MAAPRWPPLVAALLLPFCLVCPSAAGAAPPELRGDLQEETLPDAQIDGIKAVKAWAKRRVALGERRFAASGLHRRPSPRSWAGTVVYQIQVDRFNNGNVSNDHLNMQEVGAFSSQLADAAAGDFAKLPDWRHGGDLQGVRDRLGYLQDLGIQTLWITPVLMHNGGYHGYCLTDPTTTDPAFGTPEELRAFVADAHRHGISVVMDVVANHMCDHSGQTNYSGELQKGRCAQDLNEDYWAGRPVRGTSQASMNFSSTFFPPFRTEYFFSRCGPNDVADTAGEGAGALFGDFTLGMFDFNTLNYDFQEIYTDIHKYWVAYADIDGLRLDAVKHVTTDFLAYFSTEMRAYTRTLGKKNFLIIGEEAASDETWKAMSYGRMMSNPRDPAQAGKVPKALTKRLMQLAPVYLADPQFPAPGMTSLYNFYASGTARDVLRCEAPSTKLEDSFLHSEQRRILLAQSVPQKGAEPDAHLWTVLDLHDWPRFLNMQPQRTELLETALAYHLTAPGSPIIYYGLEQAFNGRCGRVATGDARSDSALQAVCAQAPMEDYGRHPDSLKRQDMFTSGPWILGSAVPEVDRLALVGNPTPAASKPWQEDAMLQRNHSVYQLTRKLVALRRSCPSLAMGTIRWHAAAGVSCGFLAYSRHPHAGPGAEVVMMVNPGGGGTVSIEHLDLSNPEAWKDGDLYVNVLNVTQYAQVHVSGTGGARLVPRDTEMQVGEVRAFVRQGQVTDVFPELGVALCLDKEAAGGEERRRLRGGGELWT